MFDIIYETISQLMILVSTAFFLCLAFFVISLPFIILRWIFGRSPNVIIIHADCKKNDKH